MTADGVCRLGVIRPWPSAWLLLLCLLFLVLTGVVTGARAISTQRGAAIAAAEDGQSQQGDGQRSRESIHLLARCRIWPAVCAGSNVAYPESAKRHLII